MIAQTLIFAVLLLIMWTIVILLVWQDGKEKKKGTAMKNNDLISRSALLEAFGEPPNAVDPLDRVWLQQFGDWLEYTDKVKAAPAVDAETVFQHLDLMQEAFDMAKSTLVPVVRCKNCIHSNNAGCATGFTWCDKYDYGVTDDFYCKTGERRTDDAD